MKNIIVFSILFCVIAMPAFAELTVEDLEKIRQIVKDSETELKSEIEKTNSKLDEIEARLRIVETGVAELRGRNIGFSVIKDWMVAICAVVAIFISIIALRKTQSANTPTPQDTQKALS